MNGQQWMRCLPPVATVSASTAAPPKRPIRLAIVHFVLQRFGQATGTEVLNVRCVLRTQPLAPLPSWAGLPLDPALGPRERSAGAPHGSQCLFPHPFRCLVLRRYSDQRLFSAVHVHLLFRFDIRSPFYSRLSRYRPTSGACGVRRVRPFSCEDRRSTGLKPSTYAGLRHLSLASHLTVCAYTRLVSSTLGCLCALLFLCPDLLSETAEVQEA
ncbi:hypothetical protein BD414DRAFT_484581 [Trametes punicea]|nr:hypothetical protein BD414DRAFT_484581 [Trametes punicea]